MTSGTAFGNDNSGFQTGTINGPVQASFHYATARPATPPRPSIVIPFARDADFVERGTLLDEICRKCARPNARIALVGLGGVGKSQLAIEHAYRTREASPETWVLWAHGSSAARLEQSFRDIADRVKVAGRHDPQANIFKLVHEWLCDSKARWLLVLDNVDDAGYLLETQGAGSKAEGRTLREYLPHCEHGSILVTSRNEDAATKLVEQHDINRLGPMSRKQAQTLLRKKLGVHAAQEDDDTVAELAAALEYMPLATVQAAAYISQRAPMCSVAQYISEFRKSERRRTSLLNRDEGQLRRDPEAKNSVITTWQISFEHIQQTQPSAADLLSLMSFFDRQGIPKSVLQIQGEHGKGRGNQGGDETKVKYDKEDDRLPSKCAHGGFEEGSEADFDTDAENNSQNDSQNGFHDAFQSDSLYNSEVDVKNEAFQDDVTALRSYCFISVHTDSTGFEMHALVQLATRAWLTANGELERWKKQFISKLSAAFPTGAYENWAACQTLFAHAKAATGHKPRAEASLVQWAMLLYRAAWYAKQRGNAAEAEQLAVMSMRTRWKVLGREHEDTWWSMAMVASVHLLRGHWDKAEKLQQQVTEKRKAKLGGDDPDTLTSLANLALTYTYQGRWEEAEELGLQVVETRKAKLGDDHPDTLTSMGNLASTYTYQGRWEKAEELGLQVVEKRKAKLGDDHPDTLVSMGNLASTYTYQGRWEEAEELGLQVVEKRKAKLGGDDPDTLTSLANLALTYTYQGRWEEAEELGLQVVETRKAKLGDDHPDTLISMGNLASTYTYQGRWKDAEKLQEQVLKVHNAKLGDDHPDTLISMGNLASTYRNQGRWEEAEELGLQVVEKRKAKLGDDHPDTLISMGNLALTYMNQGRWEKAEELGLQVVEKRKAKLGDDHPDTLVSMGNLASTYSDQGRWKDAEKLQEQVLKVHNAKLGDDHPDTLISMGNLASTYTYQGRWKDAEKLQEQVLKVHNAKLGDDHPDTLISMGNLASTYTYQGRWKDAEKLHRETLALREKVLAKNHPDTLTSIYWVAYVLQQQHRYRDALLLYERACRDYESTGRTEHPTAQACARGYAFVQEIIDNRTHARSPPSGCEPWTFGESEVDELAILLEQLTLSS